MESENENKPPLNEYQQKEVDRIVQQATNEKEIENELRTHPRFVNYFEGYTPISVDHFIKSYKWLKSFITQHGPQWLERQENESLQWINSAQDHLGYIQQKKLFDAQCLWRAEQIEIPEIEICYDFQMWEKNVLNCPFIEPITEEDIDLYSRYLQQDNVDFSQGWFEEWQDYDGIKEAYHSEDANRNFPEWYDFHISNKGGSHLLSLPDTRGEKEEFYMNLLREKNRAETNAKQAEWDKTRDKRPSLKSTFDKEFMQYFISTFESKELLSYYHAYLNQKQGDEEEEFIEIIAMLLKEKETIPMQAHYDWREALRRTHAAYKAKKIAEHLPQAFEEYQLQQSLQIQSESDIESFNGFQSVRKLWADNILNGRELNGEPRDFNF